MSDKHEILHIIGFNRGGRSEREISQAYQEELPGIRPVFLKLTDAVRVYYRTRRWYPLNRLKAFPGVLFRKAIGEAILSESPDFLWWSGDNLHGSFFRLDLGAKVDTQGHDAACEHHGSSGSLCAEGFG